MKNGRLLFGALLTVAPSLLASCAGADTDPEKNGQRSEPTTWVAPPAECAEVVARGGYYVGGPDSCALIDFACTGDDQNFSNACGCGCVPKGCPDPEEPQRDGYAHWNEASCAVADFACESDEVVVCSACGSGCKMTSCPHPRDPKIRYASHDLDFCDSRSIACGANETVFRGKCGCGCIGATPECPMPDVAGRSYVSRDPNHCSKMVVDCVYPSRGFSDSCGCGCESGPPARPVLTPEACAASGGEVVGDPGDGSVHSAVYRCPSGATPIGTIVSAEGGPIGIEGAVCCPRDC